MSNPQSVQAMPVSRQLIITQDLQSGNVVLEMENTFAAPGVPIQESRKFKAMIVDSNGFASQAMNAFIQTMQTLIPKPGSDEKSESDPMNVPVEELVDAEASARISQAKD